MAERKAAHEEAQAEAAKEADENEEKKALVPFDEAHFKAEFEKEN